MDVAVLAADLDKDFRTHSRGLEVLAPEFTPGYPDSLHSPSQPLLVATRGLNGENKMAQPGAVYRPLLNGLEVETDLFYRLLALDFGADRADLRHVAERQGQFARLTTSSTTPIAQDRTTST